MSFRILLMASVMFLVLSVIFMSQDPTFGHEPLSLHPPEFYVDSKGDNMGGKKTGPNGTQYKDPRIDDEYGNSSGNGTESASSWKLVYYASGIINGGHKKNKSGEMVYGARVDLAASAGNCSCSGSAQPSLTDDMGLTGDNPGWSGHGRIVLTIPEKKGVHILQGIWILPIYIQWCKKVDVEEAKVDTQQQNIGIRVQETTITTKESGEISGALGYGPASISATWSSGNEVAREGVHAYPFGISATLTSESHHGAPNEVAPQLDKKANVEGDLDESIRPATITAVYKGKLRDCGRLGGT